MFVKTLSWMFWAPSFFIVNCPLVSSISQNENDPSRIFDSDGNGSLDFKEFLMALDIAQCQDERQKLEWSFRYQEF